MPRSPRARPGLGRRVSSILVVGLAVAGVALAALLVYLAASDDEIALDVEVPELRVSGEGAPERDVRDDEPPADEEELSAGFWTTWERIPPDEDVFGVGRQHPMAGIAATGPGLVAVGHDSNHDAAVVWVSEDGRDGE